MHSRPRRAELAALERDGQVARWAELTEERNPSQVAMNIERGRGRPESGINAASRELGLDKMDVHRAVKAASRSEEATDAAMDTGLDRIR